MYLYFPFQYLRGFVKSLAWHQLAIGRSIRGLNQGDTTPPSVGQLTHLNQGLQTDTPRSFFFMSFAVTRNDVRNSPPCCADSGVWPYTYMGGEDDGVRASDESIVLYFCPERRIRVLTLAALPGLVESKITINRSMCTCTDKGNKAEDNLKASLSKTFI
jgi:hypothetical protein